MISVPTELAATRIGSADYRRMLDQLTAGVFFWDPARDTVEWSPRLHATLGYGTGVAATLVDIEKLLHPDDAAAHGKALATSRRPGGSYATEVRLRNAAGRFQHFEVRGYWLGGDAESDLQLIGFLNEIGNLAKLRETVARSETMFQTFFDNVPAAIYIKDPEFRHVYGNAAAVRLTGCSEETFADRRTRELFSPASAEALETADRRVLDEETTVRWSGEIETVAGERFHIVDTKFPIRDPASGRRMIGGFCIDVTRQHEMESAMARSRKLEALGQLVAGIAHDFNNSLAVLQGNLDLIALEDDGAGTDALADSTAEMRNAIERGRRLTQQLLAYGRKALLHPRVLVLNEVMDEAEGFLRRILPETIEIVTRPAPDLWNTRIDVAEFENALLNLAINARDAMPDGGRLVLETANVQVATAELDAACESGDGEELVPGRYVTLSVADSGTGMSDAVRERAFDPFFTTKSIDRGTGMGLAMVHGLARQLGGTVRLWSEPGRGTRVTLYFPATEAPVAAPPPPARPVVSGVENLLVVEDEPSLRQTLRRQLEALGYKVRLAADGSEALDLLQAGIAVDLLVTDVVMPGPVQGPRLARTARETRPGLPVLFISGYPLDGAVNGVGIPDGAAQLTKPVSLADLAQALRGLLDRTA